MKRLVLNMTNECIFQIIPFDFGQFDLADRGLIRCPGDRFKMLDMSDEFQYLITNRGDPFIPACAWEDVDDLEVTPIYNCNQWTIL